jgi:hypothetical protein
MTGVQSAQMAINQTSLVAFLNDTMPPFAARSRARSPIATRAITAHAAMLMRVSRETVTAPN